MDWVLNNLPTIASIASVLSVATAWLYLRYYLKEEQIRVDLEKLLADGLDFLKDWAGDKLEDVTEAEVAEVAGWFYSSYVIGSVLDKFVTEKQLESLFWKAFTEWRDRFVSANAYLATGL